jgi:nicotinamide-nucleotide amidase
VGFYPNFPENHVTITIRDHDEARADELLNRLDAELQSRLGPHVVALDQSSLEESLGRLLTVKGKTLAVAESCTGGLIGHRVTAVPGSSAYFERGLVVYSNQAKMDLLGVPDRTLKDHGAVSMETARIMADEIRTRARVDYGLATTGIAGPDGGTKEKPVGTVYIGLSSPEGTAVRRFRFTGGRSLIKELTAETALYWLYRYLSLGPLDGGPQDAAPRMER